MNDFVELLIIFLLLIIFSLGTTYLIWLLGNAIVYIINMFFGTSWIWNSAHSILVYAICVILFISLSK